MPFIRILMDSREFLVADSESEVRFRLLSGLNFTLSPVLRFFFLVKIYIFELISKFKIFETYSFLIRKEFAKKKRDRTNCPRVIIP